MGSGRDDVAAEAASASVYRTFMDLELLRKSRLEAEGAAAARKALQSRRISENETRKRARNGETLRGWLTGARNEKRRSIGACDISGERESMILLSESTSSAASVDASSGLGSDLQVLCSTAATLQVSSEDSPPPVGRAGSQGRSDEDRGDFEEDDFHGIDDGEARDLGLKNHGGKKKRKMPTRSYELTRRFQTVECDLVMV